MTKGSFVYNDGGYYHYLMWEMLTGVETIKHGEVIKQVSNQFHEKFSTKL
jgi:hypothetical protein